MKETADMVMVDALLGDPCMARLVTEVDNELQCDAEWSPRLFVTRYAHQARKSSSGHIGCDLLLRQEKKRKRKVYAIRRYNGSLCTQKQPETAALTAAIRKSDPKGGQPAELVYIRPDQLQPVICFLMARVNKHVNIQQA